MAPAFVIISHACQGQVLTQGAIVDLQLGRGVSIIASNVAIMRVETQGHPLIYRRCDREPFTRGAPEGPTLLLQKLRGQVIDWKAIEEKHTPQGRCNHCHKLQYKDAFHPSQWKREERLCKQCQDALKTEVE